MNLEDTQLADTAAKVEDWVRCTWNHNAYEILCMVKPEREIINQSDFSYHIHPNIFLKALPHKTTPTESIATTPAFLLKNTVIKKKTKVKKKTYSGSKFWNASKHVS